ncbi:MAG: nucleotidyltransferase family protein [Cyclobacteriaceae bacterium]
MMITKAEILSKLTEMKPILYRDYAVKEIGLFGSYADNTNNENSDIDLLIELEKPIGWRFFTLELFLEEVFDKKVDLVTKNGLKKEIKDQILKKVSFV